MGERLAFTFALTGRREWGHGTQGVALGYELAALSGRSRRGLRGIAPERGAYRGRGLPRNKIRDMSPLQGRGSLIGPKR